MPPSSHLISHSHSLDRVAAPASPRPLPKRRSCRPRTSSTPREVRDALPDLVYEEPFGCRRFVACSLPTTGRVEVIQADITDCRSTPSSTLPIRHYSVEVASTARSTAPRGAWLDATRQIGGCPTGEARLTPGYDLPANGSFTRSVQIGRAGTQVKTSFSLPAIARVSSWRHRSERERLRFPPSTGTGSRWSEQRGSRLGSRPPSPSGDRADADRGPRRPGHAIQQPRAGESEPSAH